MSWQVTIEMNVYNCSMCGLTYGYPRHVDWAKCPNCTGKENRELRRRRDELERSVSALRGCLARARRDAAKGAK